MARTKAVKNVRTTKIQATQRMSVKIRDNYYTVEFLEEREIPDNPNIDLEEEKTKLFESVKTTLYAQIEEIVEGVS